MHSLYDVDKKIKLFPRFYLDEKEDDEIKEYLRKCIIPDLYSTIYIGNTTIENAILTKQGQDFYFTLKNFTKEQYDNYIKNINNSSLEKYGSDFKLLKYRLSISHERLFRMLQFGDSLDLNNMDILTLIYCIANIYDVLANYGVDIEIPAPPKLTVTDTNGMSELYKKEIEYKIEKQNNEEKYYTRCLREDFKQKFSEDINRMYDLYYANFDKFNIPTYFYTEILNVFHDNHLMDINVDELLKTYPNVTRDEILTLCLYKLDDKAIGRYLEILNKCENCDKEKIMELIKPMHYYFPYISREVYDDTYTKYGLIKQVSRRREVGFQYIDNVINGDMNFKFGPGFSLINVEPFIFSSAFRGEFYEGYFYYITAWENFFLKQIDVYERIVDESDFKTILDDLLEIKNYILNNKMNAMQNENRVMDKRINIMKEYIQKYLNTYLTDDLEYNNVVLRTAIFNKLNSTLYPEKDEETKLMRNL